MQFLIAPIIWLLEFIWLRIGVFLLTMLPFIVEKVFKILGLALVTYVGFDLLIDGIESKVMGNFNNLGTDLLQILLILKLDVGIKIVFASMAAAIGFKSANETKKLVFKA